jgi:hypothetical protein
VAAAALACAGGGWLVDSTLVLRVLGAGAAAAAVAGAVLLRRWDRAAGRRVGELKVSRANLEWRAEERQAELEDELHEAQEIRSGLESKLRGKRIELNRLRTEHAALLRRYATAETERAIALEGRRQLALAAGEQARELTTEATDHRMASGAPTSLTYLQAKEALKNLRRNAGRQEKQERGRPAGERRPVKADKQEPEQERTEEPEGLPERFRLLRCNG